jgi:general secretion pathway protein K
MKKSSLASDVKILLRNQSGVALMFIITAMVFLMAIYGEFTFESKISRIKATNVMDRSQAKLLAESGLQLAMARFKLYQEAMNKLESNPNLKQQIRPQLLNQIWELPFVYPIPMPKNTSIALKDSVNQFEKEILLEGSMRVSVSNVSNRMNLNLLRFDTAKRASKGSTDGNSDTNEEDPNDGIIDSSPTAINDNVSIEQTLFFLLKRLVDEKKEKDPGFEDRFANINYQQLVSNIKFFVSDFGSLMTDPMAGEAEALFRRIPLTPKYGPLSSASELYGLPGWDDELIELIQNEFSVYPSAQIDLNKLTANMLRILVPTIDEEQIRSFFEYRDNPDQPRFFNSIADFQKWVVEVERIVSEQQFKDRMDKFAKAGVTFGPNPNLFKVISEGLYNRSTYTLVAYVYMPKNENDRANNTGNNGTRNTQNTETSGQSERVENNNQTGGNTTAAQATQLLEPRIIELQIN